MFAARVVPWETQLSPCPRASLSARAAAQVGGGALGAGMGLRSAFGDEEGKERPVWPGQPAMAGVWLEDQRWAFRRELGRVLIGAVLAFVKVDELGPPEVRVPG